MADEAAAGFTAADPGYRQRVEEDFARQGFFRAMGAGIEVTAPGRVSITAPWHQDFTQQHGHLHAGTVSALIDTACGYAALSLMPAGSGVVTVEFKTNFMAPAAGEAFTAYGEVVRQGRTLSVCRGELFAVRGQRRAAVATMQATMIRLTDST